MGKHLNIIGGSSNIFDYDEYLSACSANNIEPLALGIWSSLAGTMACALFRHKPNTGLAAYELFMTELNIERSKGGGTGCLNCGGGTVI